MLSEQNSIIWLLVGSLILANLPFVTNRFLAIFPMRKGKPAWMIIPEWLLCLCLAAVLGMLLERRLGLVTPQHWQFYVANVCLFILFSFPGFVSRFLWRPVRRSSKA